MRETGPIRADFFGDTGVAKAHLGLARTLLGILKTRMAAGGLQQLVRTYDLENGTRISVRSAFGQDSVIITSPQVAAGEAPVEELEPIPLTLDSSRIVIVGNGDDTGWYWTGTDGMIDIGKTAGEPWSRVYGVSGDGSTIVGYQSNSGAFRWTKADGIVPIGFFYASGIDTIGGTIVGYDYTLADAVRWTEATGVVGLGAGSGSSANGISPDGSTIVGIVGSKGAFRWTEMDGLQMLGASISVSSYANAASNGGMVIVGASDNAAFRWTKEDGLKSLGTLPGDIDAVATDVSADGSVVVGYSTNGDTYNVRAFRWTEADGMVDISDGSTYSSAAAVSADGTLSVGGVCRWY